MDKVEGVFITKEQLKEKKLEAFKLLMKIMPDSSKLEIILLSQTTLALNVFEAYINNDEDFIEKVIKELNKDE